MSYHFPRFFPDIILFQELSASTVIGITRDNKEFLLDLCAPVVARFAPDEPRVGRRDAEDADTLTLLQMNTRRVRHQLLPMGFICLASHVYKMNVETIRIRNVIIQPH